MPYHSGDQFRRSMHKDIIMASTGDVGRKKQQQRFASIYDTVLASRFTLRHCCAEFKVIGYVALLCGL